MPPRIGSRIHQVKMQSGAGIVAMSFAGDEIQKRSYPAASAASISSAATS